MYGEDIILAQTSWGCLRYFQGNIFRKSELLKRNLKQMGNNRRKWVERNRVEKGDRSGIKDNLEDSWNTLKDWGQNWTNKNVEGKKKKFKKFSNKENWAKFKKKKQNRKRLKVVKRKEWKMGGKAYEFIDSKGKRWKQEVDGYVN